MEELIKHFQPRVEPFSKHYVAALASPPLRSCSGIVVPGASLPVSLAREVRTFLDALPSESWQLTETKDQPQKRAQLIEMRFHQLKTTEKLRRSQRKNHAQLDGQTEQAWHLLSKRIHEALAGALALHPFERMVVNFSKYEEGNFLASHSDEVAGSPCYKRVLAFVWHLSEDWLDSDGGLFVDEEAEGGHRQYTPIFNSLVTFAVPRKHRVTKVVAARSGRQARFAVYGWVVVAHVEKIGSPTELFTLLANTPIKSVAIICVREPSEPAAAAVLASFSGLPIEVAGQRKFGDLCVFATSSSPDVLDMLGIRAVDNLAVTVITVPPGVERKDACESAAGCISEGCQVCSDLDRLENVAELRQFIRQACKIT